MDNMYQPPSGGAQDNWPTEQFEPAAGPPHRPRGSRSLRWSAGIALAALLVGGGALAATELTSSPALATSGSAEQAAALNTILSSASSAATGSASAPASSSASGSGAVTASSSSTASSSASSADAAALSSAPVSVNRGIVTGRCRRLVARLRATRHPRAARVVARFCRNRLVRLRALGGMHGQFTFKTKSGTRTIAFARGVLESTSTGQVIVKSADSTTWTWNLVGNTVVRERGKVVARTALADGQQVFVGGPVVSGANDARLIVIRPASSSGS
jgi:hypothetical protein